MENQPGFVKDNAVTRMLDSVKAVNQSRGHLAGRNSGTPTVPISSNSRVISAPMMEPVLSDAEKAELDAKARAAGILPEDDEFDRPPIMIPEIPTAREYVAAHPDTTRNMLEAARVTVVRELVDFKQVNGIDLKRGVAFVDAMEVEIPEKKIKELRKYVMKLMAAYVENKIKEALMEIEPEATQEEENDRA